MRTSLTAIAAASLLVLCSTAMCDDPWGPVDTSAGVFESLYGDFTGYPVTTDDVLGAFWGATLIGRSAVLFDGSTYYYPLMPVWAPTGTLITFRIWDESAGVAQIALPSYTTQNTAPPPGGPAYRHDLENEGSVPEPPTIVILSLSIALIIFFYFSKSRLLEPCAVKRR